MKFYVEYGEGTTLVEKIEAYLKEHGVYDLDDITIGCWEEPWEVTSKSIIDYMVEHKDKFPNLKKVYLGDMESEENEISWINHTDVAPLVHAFALEELTIKGATGLRMKNIRSNTLRKLTIISYPPGQT